MVAWDRSMEERRKSTGGVSTLAYWRTTGEEQSTLGAPVELSGVGLHGGEDTTIRLLPAPASKGRYFAIKRCHSSEFEEENIPASVHAVVETRLSTTLGRGEFKVQTVEHLLSALEGLRVDNVRIELKGGAEVPILDGSAKLWVKAIESVGVVTARDKEGRSLKKLSLAPDKPIVVYEGDSWVAAFPSPNPRLTCGIDFSQLPVVGKQWFTWDPLGSDSYTKEVASARTFGIMEQIEQLRAAGLIKGGSLENALVCSMQGGWLNPPLRYADEPCRHKLLDLVGDLALCSVGGQGGIPNAHVVAYKGSHSLHVKFGKALWSACGDPKITESSTESSTEGAAIITTICT